MIRTWIEKHAGWILSVCAAVVMAVQSLTVCEYPPSWFDEIEILEMGRFCFFDVHPDWSVNLFENAQGVLVPPLPMFHYLAGTCLETLYRLTDGFLCGRIFMLLSLPVCTLSLFAWLRTEGFSVLVSLLTALLFLVDPNATICAHWYRPDLWCMTLTFAALILVKRSEASSRASLYLFGAGALMAVSVFFWITSVLIQPLVLLALLRRREDRFTACVKVALGGVAATSVILIPLYGFIPDVVEQYLHRSEISTMFSAGPSLLEKCLTEAFDFVKIALRSPFVWLMTILGLCCSCGRWMHRGYFLFLIVFMVSTRVYHLRMVYLMPLIFLFLAVFLHTVLSATHARVWRGGGVFALLALAGSFTVSVVLLTYAAWPETNTLDVFTEKLQRAVPGKNPRVYLMDAEHELYYSGRRLGWKMYEAMPRKIVLGERQRDFLSSLDAIVVTACGPKLTEADRAVLRAAGFAKTASIAMPPAATGTVKRFLASFVYAHGYPSSEVWTRR